MYNFYYDCFGNQSSVYIGNQRLISNSYATHNGNLLSSTYGNDHVVSNTYDYNDRIIKKNYNGKTAFSWIYDSLGNVASHKDSINNVNYKYNYDFSGKLTSFDADNGFGINYKYDNNARLTDQTDSLSGVSKYTTYQFNSDNQPTSLKAYHGENLTYNYDGLTRLSSLNFAYKNKSIVNSYSYLDGANGNTTSLVSNYTIKKQTSDSTINLHNYSYTYDKNGNIWSIKDGVTLLSQYSYNELNELVREDNSVLKKSFLYYYDVGGNITSKVEYPYTTSTLGTPTKTYKYDYGDSNWKDKLTNYDGTQITYDKIGNPLKYIDDWNFSWENGRKLASASNGTHKINYKYNADGIRTSKTVDGVTTSYYVAGSNIIWQNDGTNKIHYTYDANGNPTYMDLNGKLYYYEKNAQNDIVGLIDTDMNEVVTYSYDTWGKLKSIGGTLKDTVGKINPLRYPTL